MTRGFLDRPDCRLYYEAEGSGPVLIFAHGLGGNYMSWWQQVPHFRDRYTCVTFSHRGFSPSSAPPGGPDPHAYGGRSRGAGRSSRCAGRAHRGAVDGRLERARLCVRKPGARARAGARLDRRLDGVAGLPVPRPDRVARWRSESEATSADLFARGIHPAGGERMAREQPALNYLYRAIDALSAGLDKTALRRRLMAALRHPVESLRTLNIPTLWLTGAEDLVFPPFVADALSTLMPNARVASVPAAGHSVYFERAAEFNRLVDEFLAANN